MFILKSPFFWRGFWGLRMTLYPPRIQLKTLLTGVILTRKMTFRRAKCFAKVVDVMETDVLNIEISVAVPPDSKSRLFGQG